MAGRKPDYRLCVPQENDGDTFFTDVGAGWKFSGEKAAGVSIKLKPHMAVSGEMVLFENRD